MKNGALGVDIGNVIIDHRPIMNTEDETLWNEKYSDLLASADVFECLKELNEGKFKDNVFLVSKLKEEQDSRTLKWLRDNKFFEKTGISPDKLFFCRERNEKERICRENNITYFIDDRLEVLSYMIGAVPNLYLFQPDEQEVAKFRQFLPKVTRVESWKEINALINTKND
jgi:hypothetical protein